jgi:hypothetical protein
MDQNVLEGVVTDEGFTAEGVKREPALSPYERDQAQNAPKKSSTGRPLTRLVWGVALLFIALAASNGYTTWGLAESAPQQAAAAGMACFQTLVPYVLARAVQEVLAE